MSERVIGYISFGVGICVMWFTVMQVYMLLTNQIKPFPVSQSDSQEEKATPVKSEVNSLSAIQDMQMAMLQGIMDEQINKSLDLGATVFFYYFLMLFGFRLSSLGVQLMRPITVKLRTPLGEEKQSSPDNKL